LPGAPVSTRCTISRTVEAISAPTWSSLVCSTSIAGSVRNTGANRNSSDSMKPHTMRTTLRARSSRDPLSVLTPNVLPQNGPENPQGEA